MVHSNMLQAFKKNNVFQVDWSLKFVSATSRLFFAFSHFLISFVLSSPFVRQNTTNADEMLLIVCVFFFFLNLHKSPYLCNSFFIVKLFFNARSPKWHSDMWQYPSSVYLFISHTMIVFKISINIFEPAIFRWKFDLSAFVVARLMLIDGSIPLYLQNFLHRKGDSVKGRKAFQQPSQLSITIKYYPNHIRP